MSCKKKIDQSRQFKLLCKRIAATLTRLTLSSSLVNSFASSGNTPAKTYARTEANICQVDAAIPRARTKRLGQTMAFVGLKPGKASTVSPTLWNVSPTVASSTAFMLHTDEIQSGICEVSVER